MSEVKSFNCPNCGSPLTAQGPSKEIKCAYCGTSVVVPEELRDSGKHYSTQQQDRANEIMKRLIDVTDPKEEDKLMAELQDIEDGKSL